MRRIDAGAAELHIIGHIVGGAAGSDFIEPFPAPEFSLITLRHRGHEIAKRIQIARKHPVADIRAARQHPGRRIVNR